MVARASGTPNEFLLPDLGEGLEEAELVEWCVRPGQRVQEHDTLAKMETAKALVEVPSPRAGVIAALHGKPGEAIEVGAPLVTYQGADGAAVVGSNGAKAGRHSDVAPADPEEPHSDPQVENPGHDHEHEDAGTVVGSVSAEEFAAGEGKVRAAPAVRRLARDLGIDLERVTGTGIGGRVTSRDVQAAAAQPQVINPPSPRAPVAPPPQPSRGN